MFVIQLNASHLVDLDDERVMGAMAHELAHVFLGHSDDEWYRDEAEAVRAGELAELDADEQGLKWGFTPYRPYDDDSFTTDEGKARAAELMAAYPPLAPPE